MHIDQNTKNIQKSYCLTVLAEHGGLTKELFRKINEGDEDAMREVYVCRQNKIREQAEKLTDPVEKELTLSQIDSIQEVLDSLSAILKV